MREKMCHEKKTTLSFRTQTDGMVGPGLYYTSLAQDSIANEEVLQIDPVSVVHHNNNAMIRIPFMALLSSADFNDTQASLNPLRT